MQRTSNPKNKHITVVLTSQAKESLDKQAAVRGMTIGPFLEYMGHAFAAGSVFIVEDATFHKLMDDEIKPILHKWVRRMVQQEVELVLVENGFLTKLRKPLT